jgi:hypothetical protein
LLVDLPKRRLDGVDESIGSTSELASRDLFGAQLDTALALENVYYSSATITIPGGARILWYVSDSEQSIRAASIALGTMRGTAKQLFRRFSRWASTAGVT